MTEWVATGGLPEEGAIPRDLGDKEGPVMCRSRRQGRCKATAHAKVLRWGLPSGFSIRKETSVAGLELGSERVMGGEEGVASRGHVGPWQGVRLYYNCDETQWRLFGSISILEQEPGFHRLLLKGSVDRIQGVHELKWENNYVSIFTLL